MPGYDQLTVTKTGIDGCAVVIVGSLCWRFEVSAIEHRMLGHDARVNNGNAHPRTCGVPAPYQSPGLGCFDEWQRCVHVCADNRISDHILNTGHVAENLACARGATSNDKAVENHVVTQIDFCVW